MLIDAYKEFQMESDNTEKIFREIADWLGPAVDTVLEAATLMFDLPLQKLLCETAFFGKKKLDADQSGDKGKKGSRLSADLYIRYLSFVNRLRHSQFCRRAITYKQLKSASPQQVLELQIKYHDYFSMSQAA